jgi:uncharacterized protein YicC (UPF0701 family)
VAVAGCNPSNRSETEATVKPIDQQMDQVESSVDQAADELNAYTYAQRQTFITKMEALSAGLTRQLDELTASVERSSAAVKADAEPRLARLKTQRDAIDEQLSAVKSANASTWERTKATTAQAYEDLKSGLNETRQWLGEAIAP